MADSSDSHHSEEGAQAPTRLQLIDRAIHRLEEADREAPRRTAEWLLTDVLDCDRGELYAYSNRSVSPEDAQTFNAYVNRRVKGEPLQHILGHTSFYGLRVQVTPEVMVPRPETELVVEQALACIAEMDAPRILDVGTGSGCIALALKHERPDATVYACDVSHEALDVARANAQALQLDVQFLEADLRGEVGAQQIPSDLDLLISNPPYIPDTEAETLPAVVREYDPDVALFSGDDPLFFYRSLTDWAQVFCRAGAVIVFEIHADYAEEVAGLLRSEGVRDVHVEDDLNDRPRIVWGRRP